MGVSEVFPRTKELGLIQTRLPNPVNSTRFRPAPTPREQAEQTRAPESPAKNIGRLSNWKPDCFSRDKPKSKWRKT